MTPAGHVHAFGRRIGRHVPARKLEVGADEARALLGVVPGDGVDDRVVLVRRDVELFLHGRVVAEKGAADAAVVDEKPGQARHQIVVARDPADLEMELVVGEDPALDVACRPQLGGSAPGLQSAPFDVGLRRRLGSELGRRDIDHRRDEEEVAECIVVHRGDARGPVGLELDITLACHLPHQLAHRRARQAEFLAELDLVEYGAGGDLHGQDTAAQRVAERRLPVGIAGRICVAGSMGRSRPSGISSISE